MFNLRRLWALCLLTGLALSGVAAQSGDPGERVLIRAAKPYGPVIQTVESFGGKVTYQYKNIDAVAAEVPRAALASLRKLLGPDAVTKDEVLNAPSSVDTVRGRLAGARDTLDIASDSVASLSAADIQGLAGTNPNAYLINNGLLDVSALHGAGFTGAGIVVAVIDSGIRPNRPHISLDGSVIGCEDFVGDALGCSNNGNNGHGTFVAGMISANVVFTFSATSSFRNAILAYCPQCVINPPTNTQIPMIGSAPLSSIYALRVFGATGGAPTSRILAAMDRALQLRQLFNAGDPSGVNVTVCNMSLGGSTVFAGRDLFDQMVDTMLANDIVMTISAGNAGPSSLTVGSPGTAFGAITVGAAGTAVHERILRDAQFGPGIGSLYRPFNGTETAYFSSRGPDADGHNDPDVTANGFASFGQGFSSSTTGVSIASGTSFSAPSTAGVAAVLREAAPWATATQIRNAIIASANPGMLADGSTPIDQGRGFVDAAAALALLNSGSVPNSLPASNNYTMNVKVNVEQNSFLKVRDGFITEHASNLLPAQRHDILYRVAPNTKQVVLALFNVAPTLPPAQQNQLFGDDILLAVHSAKTSAIGEGDYKVFTFTTGGTFVINDPEPGIMRITVNGDWTNAGTISADIAVLSTTDPVPQFTAQGKIAQGDLLVYPVSVPAGVSSAEFRLGWRQDWGTYPSADLDLILVDPMGGLNFDGAAINNPESAVVANPMAGNWLVLVSGFELHTATDKFEVRVSLDGKVVK